LLSSFIQSIKASTSLLTYLVIVRAPVRSRSRSAKAPGIYQSVEGVIVTVLEEERHYEGLEYTGFEHLPRSPMWHPADDVVKLFLGEDSIKLHGELLNANRALRTASRRHLRGNLDSCLVRERVERRICWCQFLPARIKTPNM
jgi:hypothetical protein